MPETVTSYLLICTHSIKCIFETKGRTLKERNLKKSICHFNMITFRLCLCVHLPKQSINNGNRYAPYQLSKQSSYATHKVIAAIVIP